MIRTFRAPRTSISMTLADSGWNRIRARRPSSDEQNYLAIVGKRLHPAEGVRTTILVLAASLCSSAALATPPLLLDQDRGVYARATALEAAAFDETVDPDEADDFLPFAATVGGSAATANASADAAASLDSSLSGSEISAEGSASASSSSSEADAVGEAPADSYFEVSFQATASEPFTLIGVINASASVGEAYASVEFVNLAGGDPFSSHEVAAGQSDGFSDTGSLVAGGQYRLRAFALAHALSGPSPASTSGDADYEITLFVPEPSAHLGIAAGVAELAVLGRARRRRRAGGVR
jgi:hypothetical protein